MRWFVVALPVVILVTQVLEGSPVKKSGDAAGAETSEKQKKLLNDVMKQLRVLDSGKEHDSRQAMLGDDCDYACETTYSYYSGCIPQGWVCDGEEDCTTGEDELHCGGSEPIPEFEPYTMVMHPAVPSSWPDIIYPEPVPEDCNFNCTNDAYGDCIPDSWHCDGFSDCYDSTDEQHCEEEGPTGFPTHYPMPPMAIPPDVYYPENCTFLCDNDMNGYCIPGYWECDGYPDCRDGSDELHCDGSGGHHIVCNPADFLGPNTEVPVIVALLNSVSSLPILDLMAMLNGSKHNGGPLPGGPGMHDVFPEPHGFPEPGIFPGMGPGGLPEPQVDLADVFSTDHGMYGGPYRYIAKKSTEAKKSAIQAAKELKTAAAKRKAELQELLRKGASQEQPNGKAVLAHAQKQARKWFNSKVRSVASMVNTYSHATRDLANLKQASRQRG